MTRIRLLSLALLALVTLSGSAFGQTGYPKLAPFQGVRWSVHEGATRTEILLAETWCELVELEERPVADILEFCEKIWPGRGRKRFGEDLVEALDKMGLTVGETVSLVTRNLDSGRLVEHDAVAMTGENRRSVLMLNKGLGAPPVAAPRGPLPDVVTEPDPRYAFLAELHDGNPAAGGALALDAARHDLLQLEAAISERYSYAHLTGVDRRAAFDALHLGLTRRGEELTLATFALGLRELMGLFGDGHSSGPSLRSSARPGYAPYLLGRTEEGLVAFRDDREALVDAKYPFLVQIDGHDVEEWLESAKVFGARGSEVFQREQAIENLRYLAQIRARRGDKASDEVRLTTANARGKRRQLVLALRTAGAPVYGSWPRTGDRELPGDLGYLRVESMDSDEEFVERLNGRLGDYRDTRGLVIDVRGNGGGSRTALRTLLPYFLAPDSGPRVVNVAAYKLNAGDVPDASQGYLDNRHLYPVAWSGWSAEERESIEEFARSFEPDWQLPAGFSAWHYMLVGASTNPAAYHYDRPVVVLMDTGCFSATDIFLGAFAELEQVTLLGAPSGGGSGRTRSVELPNSRLRMRLSSMASFRPNGERYDGKGIEVDVSVLPDPDDFLGRGDSQLEAAIDLLKRR